MIGLENNHCGRRARVDALPHLSCIGGRSQGIENQHLASRLDVRRGYDGLPALTRLPVRMFETPYPKARRYIPEFHVRLRVALHLASRLRRLS